MPLLKLPLDILREILDNLQVQQGSDKSISNLRLVCRSLSKIALPYLYTDINARDSLRCRKLLRLISDKPEIAPYVSHIVIYHGRPGPDPSKYTKDEIAADMRVWEAQTQDIAADSVLCFRTTYESSDEERSSVYSNICVYILLRALPNIRQLDVFGHDCHREALDIWKQVQFPELRVLWWDHEDGAKFNDLNLLVLIFLSATKLKRLEIPCMFFSRLPHDPEGVQWLRELDAMVGDRVACPSLTEISFRYSPLFGYMVPWILKHAPRLQKFAYAYSFGGKLECGNEPLPYFHPHYGNIGLDLIKDSRLEELDIERGMMNQYEIFRSLAGFTALKRIITDFGLWENSGERLVGFLPQGLQSLKLSWPQDKEQYLMVLEQLMEVVLEKAEGRMEPLVELELHIQRDNRFSDERVVTDRFLEVCKQYGVTCTFKHYRWCLKVHDLEVVYHL